MDAHPFSKRFKFLLWTSSARCFRAQARKKRPQKKLTPFSTNFPSSLLSLQRIALYFDTPHTSSSSSYTTTATMSTATAENDDFQPAKPSKKNTKRNLPRVYIGNLPQGVTESALEEVLPISGATVEVHLGPKNCHAYVSCASNKEIDQVISSLHQTQFQGRKLSCQRERKSKPRDKTKNGQKKNEYNTVKLGGWSKPEGSVVAPVPTPAIVSEEKTTEDPVNAMGAIILEEMQGADDVLNTAIASLAAVSFLAPAMNNTDDNLQEESKKDDFMALCQTPMSELMADYGEEDPDWKAVQPTLPAPTPEPTTNTTPVEPPSVKNRLGQQGKAPIHVEFISFGYYHGAPGAIRNGWSHAQPLGVFECRDLPGGPGHLSWRDGTSGLVARSMPKAMDMGTPIAEQAFAAVTEAIREGNHGYVAPLHVKIYVGSETGRHRSVVAAETAGKTLRNLLRENKDNVITCPVSVGTLHRDIERNRAQTRDTNKSAKEESV